MGGLSVWHWIIVLVVVLVLFGRGRVADVMGEFGKGIKSFKSGMNEDDKPATPAPPPQQITAEPVTPAPKASETTTTTTGGQ